MLCGRQALWLANPSLPSGLVNKVAMLAGMEAMNGFSNMDFHSLRCSVCSPCQVPSLPRPALSPHMPPFPRRMWQPPGGRWHWALPPWGRQCSVLIETDTLDVNLFSLTTIIYQKHHLWTHIIWFPWRCSHIIGPDHRTHLNSKWNAAMGSMLMEVTDLTMFPISRKWLAW